MASVHMSEEEKNEIRKKLPSWFKAEPGFKFLDCSKDLNIVLGFGGWRDTEPVGSLMLNGNKEHKPIGIAIFDMKFMPPTLVIAYTYKGEWHIRGVESFDSWEGCEPA